MPIVQEHMFGFQDPAALLNIGLQPRHLLVDGLGLRLTSGRHPGIHGRSHPLLPPDWMSISLTSGRPYPTDAARPFARLDCVEPAMLASYGTSFSLFL